MWVSKKRICWRYIDEKEEFNESDINYIRTFNLTDYSKQEVYDRLNDLMRKKIVLREKKWFDAWYIAMDLNLEFWLVKQYLKQKNAKKIVEWQKYCIWHDKWEDVEKFQHTWKRIATRCKDCNNAIRRDKRANDPIWRKNAIEWQKKCWYKRPSRYDMNEEQLLRERATQNRSTKKQRKKEIDDKIIKIRLLNNLQWKI